MKELAGKVAVVTGSGSGIGQATAVRMARQGMAVAVCDIDEAAANDTVGIIRSVGGVGSAHRVDVASEQEMRETVDAVLAAHGVVDVVVNNAGIGPAPVPTAEVPLEQLHRVMDVNFWGTIHGSVLFLPHLLARPAAHLVNVTSTAALMGLSRQAAYCSSKFAVRGFTEALRMELAPSPVRVTLVCPGFTKTPIISHSPFAGDIEPELVQDRLDAARATSPDRVAAKIVRTIRDGRPRALVGPDTAAMDALVRFAPGRYSRLLQKPIDKFLDDLYYGGKRGRGRVDA